MCWILFRLLNGFQESFILRLYREKKAGGFVKAFRSSISQIFHCLLKFSFIVELIRLHNLFFSDNPGALSGMGVLQRLLNRLYIRRVRLLPRFDIDVKSSLDPCSVSTYYTLICINLLYVDIRF